MCIRDRHFPRTEHDGSDQVRAVPRLVYPPARAVRAFQSVCENQTWYLPMDLIGENPAPEARLSLAQHGAAGGVLGKVGKMEAVPLGTAHFLTHALKARTTRASRYNQSPNCSSASSVTQFRNCLTIVPFPERLHPGRCRRRTGLPRGRRSGFLGFAIGFLAGLADIDAALEVSAIFNADALGDDVAGERAFAAEVHAVAGGHVAADFAQHHNLAR